MNTFVVVIIKHFLFKMSITMVLFVATKIRDKEHALLKPGTF